MLNLKWVLSLSLVIVIAGCDRQHDYLGDALRLSGENRVELETVLAHYKQNPADSLKYRSACFLIENMPSHYYVENTPELYNVMDSLNLSDLSVNEINTRFDSIRKQIQVPPPTVFLDLQTLSSEFLIQHIDQSFANWENTPWKEEISFENFREYILPYAVSSEKREPWIDYYRNKYLHYIADYLQKSDTIHLFDLCTALNDSLIKQGRIRLNFAGLKNYPPIAADHIRSATCEEYAARTVYLMRSLGIPAGVDYAPQWGNYHLPHSWNTLLSEDGKHYPFMGFDVDPADWGIDTRFVPSKFFRVTYSIQKNSLAAQNLEKHLPGIFNRGNIKDVSAEYFPVSDVTLEIKKPKQLSSKVAYLCVFDNTQWIAVDWGRIKGDKVTFTDMGRGVVYLPACYDGKEFIAVNSPFIIDTLGYINPLNPHPSKTETLKLERKYRISTNVLEYPTRMQKCRFQGANKPDFSDCVDLHAIEQLPLRTFNTVDLDKNYRFRYVRVYADGYSNVAEVEFYTKEEAQYRKLSGKIMGTKGSDEDRPDSRKEAAFDGDVLTYFSIYYVGAWAGLDLGRKERIDRIRFLPRNDNNNIRPGDLYELFYWDEGKWQSLGKQTGTDTPYLVYENCPAGALFLLHNHTRGKEERIFTYENDTQIWR